MFQSLCQIRSVRARALAVLVLPLACGVFAFGQLRNQQPFWGGLMSDPSYIYLLSALNIATFAAPGHVDHPGTPVQVIGALTLRALHPAANADKLASVVLTDPETHARVIGGVLIAIPIAAALGAGLWVLRRTARLDAAIFAQIGPLLIPSMLGGYSGLRPEPLLIACTHLWAAAMIVWSEGYLDLGRREVGALLGAFAGFAIACKYTFAPVVIIPLMLLVGWRARLIFTSALAMSFFASISPALPQFRRLASWVFRLAVRDGTYGHGQIAFGPQQGWTSALSETLRANGLFAMLLVVVAALITIAALDGSKRNTPQRFRRLGLATTIALAVALLMVAKQAAGAARYLIPAAACMPLGLFAVWRCFSHRLSRPLRMASAILFCLAVGINAGVAAARERANARAGKTGAEEARQWIERNLSHEAVFPYFGSSSIPFALAQADLYAQRWAPKLARIYPGFVCYELWGGAFKRDFSPQPIPRPTPPFYLTGAPLNQGVLDDARRALPWVIDPIWSNGIEAVYRVSPAKPR